MRISIFHSYLAVAKRQPMASVARIHEFELLTFVLYLKYLKSCPVKEKYFVSSICQQTEAS